MNKDISKVHARDVSFLWDAEPEGEPFTFDQLNTTYVITQHTGCVFFKPSLAEVYAWLLVYLPNDWNSFTHFCLENPRRIAGSSDVLCDCLIMGGRQLIKGKEFLTAGGVGYELVTRGESNG